MFNLLKRQNILIAMCKNIFIYFLLYQDFVKKHSQMLCQLTSTCISSKHSENLECPEIFMEMMYA